MTSQEVFQFNRKFLLTWKGNFQFGLISFLLPSERMTLIEVQKLRVIFKRLNVFSDVLKMNVRFNLLCIFLKMKV